jgi:hypothetical protein
VCGQLSQIEQKDETLNDSVPENYCFDFETHHHLRDSSFETWGFGWGSNQESNVTM